VVRGLSARSRRATGAVVAALVTVALAMIATPAHAATPSYALGKSMQVNRTDAVGKPWVGLIAPSADQARAVAGTAVDHIVIGVGWDAVEPSQGVFDSGTIDGLRAWITNANAIGLKVVLDLGLHYTPSWVFALPGQTRFVNQYGDVWHGRSSEDVANGVFDPAVRAAETDYITHLSAALGPVTLASVRIGGLLSGELRYPDAAYNGHTSSLWMYDPAAQASAPYPGWTPGTGTSTQASASLDYYFGALTKYETWMMRTVDSAFPGVDQQVMFPSWGIRPGMVDSAVASGMQGGTVAEANGMIGAGLDWADQVAAAAATGLHATVYSTWVDAPSQGTTVQQMPPIAYLAQLAAQYNLPVAGENTGGGGQAALDLTLQRAQQYHLAGVMYMSGVLIDQGVAGITLNQLITTASAS
jgi:hypothetical protein